MELHFLGLIVGLSTFFIIGLFHPIVIKTEYYWGTRYWWVFLIVGILSVLGALMIESVVLSSIIGVLGFCCFWSIKELFEQRDRVEKGWFPRNPKRKY